jgi:uncharacterized protein (TIGR03435 family)
MIRVSAHLSAFVAAALLGVVPAAAQRGALPAAPRFDVVSIKQVPIPAEALARTLAVAAACGLPGIDRAGSRIQVPIATLCGLIRVAYDVADHQVIGVPVELAKGDAANVIQIEARVEDGTAPSMDDIRLMLRTLLAERFQLRVHREPREQSVYALVAAKDGPRLKPCSRPEASSGYTPGRLVSCTPLMPMARVAQLLGREAGRPVIDKTGLAPASFELHWLPEGAQPQPDSPPFLFTAIEEQLGLKLEPQRVPIDSIVVDYAERPSPN